MVKRYHHTQSTRQDVFPQPQSNPFQSQSTRMARSSGPRERYRATQYEHPMYDAVEDDNYEQRASLDEFGKSLKCPLQYRANYSLDTYLLQQPDSDRQYRASRGQARLTLAPALSRSYDDQPTETVRPQPWTQCIHEESYEDGGTSDFEE